MPPDINNNEAPHGAEKCLMQIGGVCLLAKQRVDNFGRKKFAVYLGLLVLVLGVIYWLFFSSPWNFPSGKIVRIKKGLTTSEIAQNFYDDSLIRSPFLLKVLVRLNSKNGAVAGGYIFKSRANVFSIAYRLTHGVYDLKPYVILIPEGTSNKEIAALLTKRLPSFNERIFMDLTSDKEGMLFPDTYKISAAMNEEDIASMLYDNFVEQLKTLEPEIKKSNRSFTEILTMASIIEAEARNKEDRRIISGILWKRLDKGMKLQVDATFGYFMGKYSLQLTKKDLAYDSPYNTYKYKGLPPGPITNPGLDAIDAALHPKDSPYFFYLADSSGKTHYSVTFEGHKDKKDIFLP